MVEKLADVKKQEPQEVSFVEQFADLALDNSPH
jgi:hypothetical protein